MSNLPPLPAEPVLSYATEYVETRRPSSIVAMGVLSIIFAVCYAGLAIFGLAMAGGLSTASARARATVNQPATPAVTFNSVSSNGLSEVPRAQLIAKLGSMTPFTAAQRDVLDGFLLENGADIDPRARSVKNADDAARIVTEVGKGESQEIVIRFSGGRLTVTDQTAIFEPSGTTDIKVTDFSAASPAPGRTGFSPVPSTTNTAMRPMPAPPSFNLAPTLQYIGSSLGIVLAALLLAAGIQTLRSRPSGRRLHNWWAGIKLPAAILSATTVFYFYYEILTSSAATVPGQAAPGATGISLMMAIFTLAIALLYPIAVLIVMNLRSVKNYLSSMA